jgi:hypothetical protein
MVRRWYLEPATLVQRVFELGFAAGASGRHPTAASAARAHHDELFLLARGFGAPDPSMAAATSELSPAPGDAGEQFVGGMRLTWSPRALRQLSSLQALNPKLSVDVPDWTWLNAEGLALLYAYPNLPTPLMPSGARIDAEARLAAFVVSETWTDYEVAQLAPVPKALRADLLRCRVQGDLAPAQALAWVTSSPPAEASVETSGDETEGPTFNMGELRPHVWSARACREALAAKVEVIPAEWLSTMAALTEAALVEAARALRWPLRTGREYDARHCQGVLYLIVNHPRFNAPMVDRCARFHPPEVGVPTGAARG